jgi:hypothetical protein
VTSESQSGHVMTTTYVHIVARIRERNSVTGQQGPGQTVRLESMDSATP